MWGSRLHLQSSAPRPQMALDWERLATTLSWRPGSVPRWTCTQHTRLSFWVPFPLPHNMLVHLGHLHEAPLNTWAYPVLRRILQFPLVCMHAKLLSRLRLFLTLWTVAHQAPLSMEFSRPAFWSRLPCRPPGDLPNPGIKPASPVAPALQGDSLQLSHWGSPEAPRGPPRSVVRCLHQYGSLRVLCLSFASVAGLQALWNQWLSLLSLFSFLRFFSVCDMDHLRSF